MARRRGKGRKRRTKNAHVRKDKPNKFYVEGVVEKTLPNAFFRVRADEGFDVLTTVCGKMRRMWIRVVMGDRVTVELDAYDPTRGRIIYRQRADRRVA